MKKLCTCFLLVSALVFSTILSGCSNSNAKIDGKTVVELVQYKPEAVAVFEQLAEKFNATHDDIYLKVDSPNDEIGRASCRERVY